MIDKYEIARKVVVYGTLVGLYTIGIALTMDSYKPHSQLKSQRSADKVFNSPKFPKFNSVGNTNLEGRLK